MAHCHFHSSCLRRSLHNKHPKFQKKSKESLLLPPPQNLAKRFNLNRITQTLSNKTNKNMDTITLAINRQTAMQLKKNSLLLRTRTIILENVLIILIIYHSSFLKIFLVYRKSLLSCLVVLYYRTRVVNTFLYVLVANCAPFVNYVVLDEF